MPEVYEVWVIVRGTEQAMLGEDRTVWFLVESDFKTRQAAIDFVEQEIEPRLTSSPGWESGHLNRLEG